MKSLLNLCANKCTDINLSNKIQRTIMIIIVFTMMLTAACYASDSESYIRVRIRRPRKFNEQADLKGYGSIKVYNILESEDIPIAVLGENVDILLDSFYNERYLIQETDST